MRVKIRRRVPSPIWWSGVGGKETGDKSESRTRPGELPPRSQENVLKKKKRDGGEKQSQILQVLNSMDKKIHWIDKWRSLMTVDRAIIGEVQVQKVSVVLMLRN